MIVSRGNSTMILYRIFDFLIAIICWNSAYILRFGVMASNIDYSDLEIPIIGIAVAIITLLFFSYNDLYTSQRYFSWHHELLSVFKSHFQAISTVIVLLYVLNPSRLSRIMLLTYSISVVVLSLSGRLLIKSFLTRRRRKGFNLKQVVLIGANKSILEYAQKVIQTPELGLRIMGWLDSQGKAKGLDIAELSSVESIPTVRGAGLPDALIIGYEVKNYPSQNTILAHFNKTVVPVWILPDIEHTFIGYTIESFHSIPMLKINAHHLSILESLIKRSIDILGSLLALIFLSPVFLLISIIVKLSSKGPVFYHQERVSQNGHIFTMWKYRSMFINSERESSAVWTEKNDSRVTAIGSFLRKTSLDEIPQFWNVLKGDMSLVGPRPERPVLIEKFRDQIPSYMLRHKMKSGLTGWAQVNGWRGNTSLEKRIEFDLYYIQNWTIWLDIKILFLTFLRGFVNPNAY